MKKISYNIDNEGKVTSFTDDYNGEHIKEVSDEIFNKINNGHVILKFNKDNELVFEDIDLQNEVNPFVISDAEERNFVDKMTIKQLKGDTLETNEEEKLDELLNKFD